MTLDLQIIPMINGMVIVPPFLPVVTCKLSSDISEETSIGLQSFENGSQDGDGSFALIIREEEEAED